MKKKIFIPAFLFKSISSEKTTTTVITRQDDTLELEFPVYKSDKVMEVVKSLSTKKRRAHDRPIDEIIEIIDQVGALWQNPNYEFRKEALEVIPMVTGQSRKLCEIQLMANMQLWSKRSVEMELSEELGGKRFLDGWVPKGGVKLHAQPRGLIYHNLAGNAFNVGMLSLYFSLITKNVNLVKLAREEPFFTIKIAESIAEVDRKIAQEMAVLYFSGRQSEVYDKIFNSGYIDGVIAWGGLESIENIRKRAYQYGVNVIAHGPKMSFSIISEDALKDENLMSDLANKIAADVAFWNQKACVSPRVIYIKEKDVKSAISEDELKSNININKNLIDKMDNNKDIDNNIENLLGKMEKTPKKKGKSNLEIDALMQRSVKLLRDEITDLSPLGFAKTLAESMESVDKTLPRAHLTQADGVETASKREYFSMKYELTENGVIFSPKNDQKMNWTVLFLRKPPTMQEIDRCMNRFIIVTKIDDIQDLIYFMRKEKLNHYLQTISIYGNDEFLEEVAEEFSLLGACRFPRVGEHNMVKIGTPWDGHYVLQSLIRWVYIGFDKLNQESIGINKDSKLNFDFTI